MTSTGKRTGAEPLRAHRPAIKRAAILLAMGATIGLGAQAYGQTIRFDNPAHGAGGHFHWPLETPTLLWLDIKLAASAQPAGGPTAGTFVHTVFPAPTNGSNIGSGGVSEVQVGNTHTSALVGFEFGETIPGSFDWAGSGIVTHSSIGGSEFLEGVEKYVGVRFDLGFGWQYGWIGGVRTGLELEVFAWGYEQTPGVPIAAGIPAPASVALLALGGLVAARRRR